MRGFDLFQNEKKNTVVGLIGIVCILSGLYCAILAPHRYQHPLKVGQQALSVVCGPKCLSVAWDQTDSSVGTFSLCVSVLEKHLLLHAAPTDNGSVVEVPSPVYHCL